MTKQVKRRKAMRYVVSYSGGLGSFLSAWMLKEQGFDMELVFCDTKIEDPDLYRFLDESAKALEMPLIKLEDGRTPWQVFRDVRFIGNSRIAPCSKILKRDVFIKYIARNYSPEDCQIVLGFDGDEAHRIERARANWSPYQVAAPLESIIMAKNKAIDVLKKLGIAIPRLYRLGFAHNNCGGFCVRAGTAQFRQLKREFPERYEHHANQEEALLRDIETTRPFLRKTIDGELRYITLKQFESDLQTHQIDFDFGGCGCFDDDTTKS